MKCERFPFPLYASKRFANHFPNRGDVSVVPDLAAFRLDIFHIMKEFLDEVTESASPHFDDGPPLPPFVVVIYISWL